MSSVHHANSEVGLDPNRTTTSTRTTRLALLPITIYTRTMDRCRGSHIKCDLSYSQSLSRQCLESSVLVADNRDRFSRGLTPYYTHPVPSGRYVDRPW